MLSRSPSAIFRLVAFLSSDAIRMDVDKIGPLLRRRDGTTLLNAVAPAFDLWKEDLPGALTAPLGIVGTNVNDLEKRMVNKAFKRMSTTAWTLRHQIGTQDLGKLIAAYPNALLLDAEEKILPTATYLIETLGIEKDALPRVLQLYPFLLGEDIDNMEGVVDYLLSIDIPEDNLGSMFRAFPALLTMKIKDMQPVVEYLKSIGISNVGRFIA